MTYQDALQDLMAGKDIKMPDPDLTDRENKRLESLIATREDAAAHATIIVHAGEAR